MKVLIAIGSYLLATFLLGATLGSCRSPNWESAVAAEQAVVRGALPRFPSAGTVTLVAECGTRLYSYDLHSDSFRNELIDLEAIKRLDYPRRGKIDDVKTFVSLAIGAPAAVVLGGGTVAAFLPGGADDAATAAAVAAGFLLIGGGIGYAITYDEKPNCGTSAVRAAFADHDLWKQIAAKYFNVSSQLFSRRMRDYCRSETGFWRSVSAILRHSEYDLILSDTDRRQLSLKCASAAGGQDTDTTVAHAIGKGDAGQ